MFTVLAIALTAHLHDWSMKQTLRESDREIVLCDVYKFGVQHRVSLQMYRNAMLHKSAMSDEIQAWNHPDGFGQWERECDWRLRCWSKLEDALRVEQSTWNYWLQPDGQYRAENDYSVAVAFRLQCLYDLRGLIGKEAFEAGWMPSPFPEYKRLPWR